MTRIFALLLTVAGLQAAVVSNFQLYSTSLSKNMDVSLMVPDEYADSTAKYYPVLYCLHGANSPYTTYTSMGTLKTAIDTEHPMIVVTYGSSGYSGEETFFFNELIPHVEANYRALTDSTKRALTGFSMGGFGSFHFMLERPGYFAAVITLSAAFHTSSHTGVDAMVTAGTPFPAIMMDCGSADTWLYSSQDMHARLTGHGIPHVYGETLGASHEYGYWNAMSDSVCGFAWKYFDRVPPLAPTGLSAVPTEHAVALTWAAPGTAADNDTAFAYAVYRDDSLVGRSMVPSFTDKNLAPATAFVETVYTLDDADNQSLTGVIVNVSTVADSVAPVVVKAVTQGLTETAVYFDEDIDPVTAAAAGNYMLDGGVTVSAAAAQGNRCVVLTTSLQTDGTEYTLSVSGVKDVSAAGNTISPAQDLSFTALATFYDDFENGFKAHWLPSGAADWAVVPGNGGHIMSMTDSPADVLYLNRSFGTFTMDAEVQAPDASAYRHVKLVFGYTDSLNYYDVDFAGVRHASYNGVFKTTDGTAVKLVGDAVEATITDSSIFYHVRVEVDGDARTVKAYCTDYDVPVFETDIPDYTGGAIGLWSHRGKLGNFDDIIVSQYVRTGEWASVDDTAIPETMPVMTVSNPVSLSGLRAAGWEARTLDGRQPDMSYRGVVILLDGKGAVVRQLILSE